MVKEFGRCSLVWGSLSNNAQQDSIWLEEDEPDDRCPWGGKIIGKLLLTVTITDPQQLDRKEKSVIYTRAFIEIYNWRYKRLVRKTH